MPAMQPPRIHGHPTDAIAGKPAPTELAPAVGAGLARDAGAANSLTPHRRHRRRACSNRARASCGNGSCPRCSHRELTGTPPTPSQASQFQQSPRQLWERVLPAMQAPRTRRHPTDAIAGEPAPTDPRVTCRSRACPRCRLREGSDTPPKPRHPTASWAGFFR